MAHLHFASHRYDVFFPQAIPFSILMLVITQQDKTTHITIRRQHILWMVCDEVLIANCIIDNIVCLCMYECI